jgi:uncharacterized protein (TIGR03067 family)
MTATLPSSPLYTETVRCRILFGCLGLILVVAPLVAQDAKEDLKKLQGTWEFVAVVDNGKEVPADKVKGAKVIVTEDKVKLVPPASAPAGAKEMVLAIKLDPAETPKAIDLTPTAGPQKDETARGIYQIEGDTLKLCLPGELKQDRPTALESKEGSRTTLLTLKRVTP